MDIEEAFLRDDLTLIGYLPAGYPDPAEYQKCVGALSRSGFRVLEIGLPSESSGMDGKIIEAAMRSVLGGGQSLAASLRLGGDSAKRHGLAPVGMLYFSMYLELGGEACAELFKEADVGAILVPDLPPPMLEAYAAQFKKKGILPIGFIPLNADMGAIEKIVDSAEGFVYCQSYGGRTGETFRPTRGLRERVSCVKRLAEKRGLPVAVGFGLRTKGDLDEVRAIGADGAIIGSAIVDAARGGEPSLARFLESLRKGILTS